MGGYRGGQSGMADHFGRVFATDVAPGQIAEATPHPRVTYSVAAAEDSGLPDASVDLVTVALNLPWSAGLVEYATAEVPASVAGSRPGPLLANRSLTRSRRSSPRSARPAPRTSTAPSRRRVARTPAPGRG